MPPDPETQPNLYEMWSIAFRFKNLLDDPQPGLVIWMTELDKVMRQLRSVLDNYYKEWGKIEKNIEKVGVTPMGEHEVSAVLSARLKGYDGEPCPYCNQRKTVHSGARYACDSCGERWEK